MGQNCNKSCGKDNSAPTADRDAPVSMKERTLRQEQESDDGTLHVAPPTHFILLQHGSHGKRHQLQYLRKHCEALFGGTNTTTQSGPIAVVWDTKVNEKRNTDAGLLVCVDRLWKELRPALLSFVEAHETYMKTPTTLDVIPQQLHFSCIGHSFGGLIIRDIIHLIDTDPMLGPKLSFHTFATLATPHLGVTDMHPTLKKGALFVGNKRSVAYLDLLLETDVLYTRLIDEGHIKALARFEQRLLYANTYDHLVSFPSASLRYDLLKELQEDLGASSSPCAEQDKEKEESKADNDCLPVAGYRVKTFSRYHPHVLEECKANVPHQDTFVTADTCKTNFLDTNIDKRAIQIRDTLLTAGHFKIFPTHFAFCGFNIAHAYIVGMGPCRGKYCQDVSNHVAMQIAELEKDIRKKALLKYVATTNTLQLVAATTSGEENATTTIDGGTSSAENATPTSVAASFTSAMGDYNTRCQQVMDDLLKVEQEGEETEVFKHDSGANPTSPHTPATSTGCEDPVSLRDEQLLLMEEEEEKDDDGDPLQ